MAVRKELTQVVSARSELKAQTNKLKKRLVASVQKVSVNGVSVGGLVLILE